MKDVFTHQDHARVGLYQSILEKSGILTYIRNENSHHSLTEIPVPLFYPTLCVVNDEDYDAALEILRPIEEAPPELGPDWQCAQCQESVPANFDACWKCGAARGSAGVGAA